VIARIALIGLAVHGCVQRCPEASSPAPATAPAAQATETATALPPAAPAGAPAPSGDVSPPANPPAPEAAASSPPASAPAQGSLPELTITNVGLHIGGGSNDDAARAPFKRAIEARFEDFRRCYLLVDEPGKGGTYGADLFIGRDGGKPDVRQPRTGMKGAKFRECMLAAFKAIEFEKPKAGPTVISYSLRFDLANR
jgi:hypothetical protein